MFFYIHIADSTPLRKDTGVFEILGRFLTSCFIGLKCHNYSLKSCFGYKISNTRKPTYVTYHPLYIYIYIYIVAKTCEFSENEVLNIVNEELKTVRVTLTTGIYLYRTQPSSAPV